MSGGRNLPPAPFPREAAVWPTAAATRKEEHDDGEWDVQDTVTIRMSDEISSAAPPC